MGFLSLKKITGDEGLNLGEIAKDITSSPLGTIALGALLGPAGMGLSALQAGLITGGIGALANNGNLGAGLRAGLGAYGGAGLGAGLMGAGMGTAITPEQVAQHAFTNEIPMDVAKDQLLQQAAQKGSLGTMWAGAQNVAGPGGLDALSSSIKSAGFSPLTIATATAMPLLMDGLNNERKIPDAGDLVGERHIRPYTYDPRTQFFTALPVQKLAYGGPVEMMSNANAVGANTGYPMADIQRGAYATPYQQPISQNVLSGAQDTRVDPYTGAERLAGGGLSDLGAYSDGGRLLRGPGDGVSDSIPAVIGGKQPARLADGEFVVPARIVSELGNGSTEAGARKLYAMMDRVQKARSKTTGSSKDKVASNTRADRYLPA